MIRFYWLREKKSGPFTVGAYNPTAGPGHEWYVVGDEVPFSDDNLRDQYEVLQEIHPPTLASAHSPPPVE